MHFSQKQSHYFSNAPCKINIMNRSFKFSILIMPSPQTRKISMVINFIKDIDKMISITKLNSYL